MVVVASLLAAGASAGAALAAGEAQVERDTESHRVQSLAATAAPRRGTSGNLVANGGFDAMPNPLAFWTNAPGAFATWVSEGANASPGAVHVRFLPPLSRGEVLRGAIYYTGLTQCVALPRAARYRLTAYARVPDSASASSRAGLAWTLRANGPNCIGPSDGNGWVNVPRSTAWTASSPEAIVIDDSDWTADATLEIAVQVGDSSTTSIEAVEALVDGIVLIEGSLFADGFEE